MTDFGIYLLLIHAGATWAMVGLIWFVQVVHYPLFTHVGRTEFTAYERAHQSRTTVVVAPLMLIELAAAVALLWLHPESVSAVLAWLGVGLIAVLWLLTYFVQVPQHVRLAGGYDSVIQQKLVRSNWVRTMAWSARGVIALAMIAQVLLR